MAINISDFDKIWASTSPLTPYSFSESNYKEGWNFVGATPPARQMWDSYMKWSDEKQQYIVNNFLPLSGGTLTGALTLNNTVVNEVGESAEKGINPGSVLYPLWYAYYDKNGVGVSNRVCGVGGIINVNGTIQMGIHAYKWVAESTDIASVYVVNTTSGDKYFRPNGDNSYDLGISLYRWKQLYAGTSTINTSDERLKDNIEPIPNEVLDAWAEVDWYQFQFKDAIAEKGKSARIHTGTIAQRIKEVFEKHNLDAFRYGLLCHDSWDATEEEKDEDGKVVQEYRPSGDLYSLRYEEALCMEASYQRRRADRLEARLNALEDRIAKLEG